MKTRILMAASLIALVLGWGGAAHGAPSRPTINAQTLAQHLLNGPAARLTSGMGRTRLEHLVYGDNLGKAGPSEGERGAIHTGTRKLIHRVGTQISTFALPSAAFGTNIAVYKSSVSDKREDQTTQSETSEVVLGSGTSAHIIVGYNTSSHRLLRFDGYANYTGYAYSTTGGGSFIDGGTIPNAAINGGLNFTQGFGDPWLANDSAGNIYFANLAGDNTSQYSGVEVVQGTFTGSVPSWKHPVEISPQEDDSNGHFVGYFGDKERVTAGPAGTAYVAWDDFFGNFDSSQTQLYCPNGYDTGLPVATSTDGGQTYSTVYVDANCNNDPSFYDPNNNPITCNYTQYIGADPVYDSSSSNLYLSAERITYADDTNNPCTPDYSSGTWNYSEVIYKSTNGGQSWDALGSTGTTANALGNHFSTINNVAQVGNAGVGFEFLGTGQIMRTIEFPDVAISNGTLYAVWNNQFGDCNSSCFSHIAVLSSPTSDGVNWSPVGGTTPGDIQDNATMSGSSDTLGQNTDELQPAISVNTSGIHVAYYEVTNPLHPAGALWTSSLDVMLANSANGGSSWTIQRLTNVSFTGVPNYPQFDPGIAFGYMGDYIANTAAAGKLYFSWGDNGDILSKTQAPLFPNGRPDPDVYEVHS